MKKNKVLKNILGTFIVGIPVLITIVVVYCRFAAEIWSLFF